MRSFHPGWPRARIEVFEHFCGASRRDQVDRSHQKKQASNRLPSPSKRLKRTNLLLEGKWRKPDSIRQTQSLTGRCSLSTFKKRSNVASGVSNDDRRDGNNPRTNEGLGEICTISGLDPPTARTGLRIGQGAELALRKPSEQDDPDVKKHGASSLLAQMLGAGLSIAT